jgi:AhpD family alkylhydroperoxidase
MDHFDSTVDRMTKRIALNKAAGSVYRAIDALDESVEFDPALRELVRIRASQLNGCSYCVDYHSGDAQAAGEDDRRIWSVSAWRHNPLFVERERAALALTDALTRLPDGGVPDEVYDDAARHFDDAELGNLIGAIIAINAWNRVGVGTGLVPESPAPAHAVS